MQSTSSCLFVAVTLLALSGCGGKGGDSAYTPSGLPIEPYTDNDTMQTPESSTGSLACEEHDKQHDDRVRVSMLDLVTYPAYSDFIGSFDASTFPPTLSFASSAVNSGAQLGLQANALAQFCSYELFAEDQCVSFPGSGSIEDGVLSLTWSNNNDGSSASLTVNDREYSSGRLVVTEADGMVGTSEWTRSTAGVETFDYSNSLGSTVEFRELPDCSGTVKMTQVEDSVLQFVTTTTWNSPIGTDFNLSWEHCDHRSGEADCEVSE